jgi:nicotinate phosphoribosyltransferase
MLSGTAGSTTALRTDHYELSMLAAARRSGTAGRATVFEVFARSLPPTRRFGVVAGSGRLADAIARFRFGEEEIASLRSTAVVDDETLAWLARYRFAGNVYAYRDGETYFPDSPVVRVEASFAEAVILETLVLSILNHDSAVASAAARISMAADPGAQHVDMGGRRTHEDAAVDAARAAYIAGFHATSNLEAGRRYGIPTVGTAAHAFTLVHDDEAAAFAAQIEALGAGTTLLVDTFDIESGIRTAVTAARRLGHPGPGGVRIDSGNLPAEARRARALLDELGAVGTRIVVSGDLDEFEIDRLERDPHGRAPVDAYGVGTRLATGSGHPTAGFVYKLVEVDGRRVAKRSAGKATVGGAKIPYRYCEPSDGSTPAPPPLRSAPPSSRSDGSTPAPPPLRSAPPSSRGDIATAELLMLDGERAPGGRPLQVPVVTAGQPAPVPTLAEARAHHFAVRAELPDAAFDLTPGTAVLIAQELSKEKTGR